jgi:hypothetical protein
MEQNKNGIVVDGTRPSKASLTREYITQYTERMHSIYE